jgi:hypothetical protein
MFSLLAQATQVTAEDFKSGYSGLIVSGLIFLAAIVVGIWWLKRQA